MNHLAQKIVELLPILEERGTIYLFAFVEREDVNLWDVVISSKWSDEGMAIAVFTIAKLLHTHLEPQEMSMIARIVPIPSSEIPVELDGITPKDGKIISESFLGLDIRRAFVFKAQRPLAFTTAGSLVGAGTNT